MGSGLAVCPPPPITLALRSYVAYNKAYYGGIARAFFMGLRLVLGLVVGLVIGLVIGDTLIISLIISLL